MGPIRIGGPSHTPIDGPGAHIFVDLDVPIIICARNVNTAILIGEAFFLIVNHGVSVSFQASYRSNGDAYRVGEK